MRTKPVEQQYEADKHLSSDAKTRGRNIHPVVTEKELIGTSKSFLLFVVPGGHANDNGFKQVHFSNRFLLDSFSPSNISTPL